MEQLRKQYEEAIQAAAQWEHSLELRFQEDKVIDILNLVSYWSNQVKGFGHLNDEDVYDGIRAEDIGNTLYKEARIGFEHSKRCYQLRIAMKQQKS